MAGLGLGGMGGMGQQGMGGMGQQGMGGMGQQGMGGLGGLSKFFGRREIILMKIWTRRQWLRCNR
jgi:hypothetical protein